MLDIMEQYGWDYHTYLAQPTWVIELIIKKRAIEAQQQKTRK